MSKTRAVSKGGKTRLGRQQSLARQRHREEADRKMAKALTTLPPVIKPPSKP